MSTSRGRPVSQTPSHSRPLTRSIVQSRELNSSAPISQLPPEILSLIFYYIWRDVTQADEREANHFRFPSEEYQNLQVNHWISVTWVCSRWRELALDMVLLWQHIILTKHAHDWEWTQKALQHSKKAPLVVLILNLCYSTRQMAASEFALRVRELRTHLSRCRSLSIRLGDDDLVDVLSQCNTQLVELYCHSSLRSETSPLVFNDSLVRSDSLRRLGLTNLNVDWNATFFQHLTHLWLDDIPVDSRLTCREFIAFLPNKPALEALYLYDSLKSEDANVSPVIAGTNRTHLPRLKYFFLFCEALGIARFLHSIILPPFCGLTLRASEPSEPDVPWIHLTLSWISNHFRPPPPPSPDIELTSQNYLRSLRIVDESATSFGIRGCTDVIAESDRKKANTILDFSISRSRNSGDWVEEMIATPILASLPLSHIVILEVAGYGTTVSKFCWLNTFGTIPTLEVVRLDLTKYEDFFEALTNASVPLPFPALSSISVHNYLGFTKFDYPFILKSLRLRSELGAPLHQVLFSTTCPPISSSISRGLGMVVKHVGRCNAI